MVTESMTDNEKFVEEFFSKHTTRLNKVARKYLIPNRYSVEDMKQYIAAKMLEILNKRETSDNPIENPERYFCSCLDFYCIEYQRRHGFIFGLPTRPRKNCEDDELEARSRGFKYLGDLTTEEWTSLVDHTFDSTLEENQTQGGETPLWSTLTGVLGPEESQVICCIYLRNMTWKETSIELNVPQSTCWSWKNRGLRRIFRRFDWMSGEISTNINSMLRNDEDTIAAFTGVHIPGQ